MKKAICFLIYILCVKTALTKEKNYSFNHIIASVGNWSDFVGEVQTSSSGAKNSNFDFDLAPVLLLSADFPILDNQYYIIPELGYVFRRTSEDNAITKDVFIIGASIMKTYNKFQFRLGSSYIIQTITGSGGEVQLGNGNSTSTYFIPSERSTSINQTVDLGFEYYFKNSSIRFQTYIYAIFEPLERMHSDSISYNYYFTIKEL